MSFVYPLILVAQFVILWSLIMTWRRNNKQFKAWIRITDNLFAIAESQNLRLMRLELDKGKGKKL